MCVLKDDYDGSTHGHLVRLGPDYVAEQPQSRLLMELHAGDNIWYATRPLRDARAVHDYEAVDEAAPRYPLPLKVPC